MPSLEDLERTIKQAEVVDEDDGTDEENGEELLVEQDIQDAIGILRKCMHLLDYVSDTDLCKSVTKRERETMGRLSEMVREYLEEVDQHYDEGQE